MTLLDLPPGVKPSNAPYQPRGPYVEGFYARDDELCFSGPAGTGKSRFCLEKVNILAQKYAGLQSMSVRQTRDSITNSIQVIFERRVLPPGALGTWVKFNHGRQRYEYWNGSMMVLAGLDNPLRAMSSEYDIIYANEATELKEDGYEHLTTRLRVGVLPYKQLLSDCNPGPPTHWLKRRADEGLLRMVPTLHEHNPAVDQSYLDRLERLTGVRRKRLFLGQWVAAEGQVWEGWEEPVGTHLIDRGRICGRDALGNPKPFPPPNMRRIWVVDFGHTAPFVWQAWAIDGEGRAYRYREIYMSQREVSRHAEDILRVTKGDRPPEAVICDWDAESRAQLERYLGVRTTAAKKAILPGVHAVADRLKLDGQGKPRLYLLTGSLVERDEDRYDARLPTCTEEEIGGYVWDTESGKKKGDQPLQEDDHGCDAMRYAVAHMDNITSRSSGLVLPIGIGKASSFRGLK